MTTSLVKADQAASARVLQLDALRGLAACVVLAGHLAQVFWQPFVDAGHALVHGFATASRHAVLVFFLLSGYLIAAGIQRNVVRQGRFQPETYAAARLARLLPPLAGALLVTALAAIALALFTSPPPALQARPLEYLTALLMLGGLEQANPVLWSLNIEARLYLIAGVAAWAWTRRPRAAAGLALALLLTVLCTAERGDFLLFAAVWLTGAAAATLPPVLQLWRRRLCVAALGTCLLLLLLQPLALSILEPRPWLNAGIQLLAGLAYAVLLFDLRWPRPLLLLPAAAAGFSYTLYLLHWPLLVLLMTALQPAVSRSAFTAAWGTALSAALALLLAWALARPLEQAARFRALIQGVGRRVWPGGPAP
ncbi:MAG: acyltransferase family protein [Rubrivivax sp.]|nr:acyltransferase family protein [Rubrivivax sp.]